MIAINQVQRTIWRKDYWSKHCWSRHGLSELEVGMVNCSNSRSKLAASPCA